MIPLCTFMTVYINAMYYVIMICRGRVWQWLHPIPKRVRCILTPHRCVAVLLLNCVAGDDLLEKEHQEKGEGTL
ncbi:hypothetical protein Fmac_020421 [Flemingia macrophylla]|uniref:Uncharacterized protein n=1 Tax=Flemingia macrophylla TaxID=520843 RepID=A0ABD1LTY7_9FABA